MAERNGSTQRLTLADRYAEASGTTRRRALERDPEVQEVVRRMVDAALSSAEFEGNEDVQVGICGPRGLLGPNGYVLLDGRGRVEQSSLSANPMGVLEAMRKAVEEPDSALQSRVLPSTADTPYAYDDAIEPPWNFDVMQALMATSTMHASAIETKASDYAYSGWTLDLRPDASALLAEKALREDDVRRAREVADTFLRTCADGCPIEDVCRDQAIEFENLGTCALEPIRSRGGLVTRLRSAPFRTIRYLHPRCGAYEHGARYIQKRGNVKRYFRRFGDTVLYARGFDPMTARLTEFPVTEADRKAAVSWAEGQIRAEDAEPLAGTDFDRQASELYVLPRRPFTASDMYGTPAGVQALPAMLALRKIEEYNLQFFEAKGVPQYAIIIKKLTKGRPGAPLRGGANSGRSGDDIARLTNVITEFFTNRVRQADRSVLVMRLFGDAEVQFERLSSEKVEASFAEYEDRMKEDIRMSHRMPPAALGINQETANIGSGRDTTQLRRYRDHIVVPGQRQFAQMVNTILRASRAPPRCRSA